ncbi:hypothetical protein [Phenylobacterium sp.]|uniref:hypothetical protein n=1 Tax=Phenylobacterium sp. TaxID=1871053 RepID=UPI004035A739
MSTPVFSVVAGLLAAEALLITRKHGPRAARRCNRRMRRALGALDGPDLWTRLLPSAGFSLTPAEEVAGGPQAQALIRHACVVCGRCERHGIDAA